MGQVTQFINLLILFANLCHYKNILFNKLLSLSISFIFYPAVILPILYGLNVKIVRHSVIFEYYTETFQFPSFISVSVCHKQTLQYLSFKTLQMQPIRLYYKNPCSDFVYHSCQHSYVCVT